MGIEAISGCISRLSILPQGRATLWRAPTQECRLVRERSMEAH
jgi:hypothetical protein